MQHGHYLTPLKRSVWPNRVAIVGYVDGEDYVILRTIVKENGHYRALATEPINDCTAIWFALTRSDLSSKTITVLSQQCITVWTECGLWPLIEEDIIHIVDKDVRTSWTLDDAIDWLCLRNPNPDHSPILREAQALISRQEGILVIQNPPNILYCTHAESKRKITWLDVHNFGVQLHTEELSAIEQVEAITKWFIGFHEASFRHKLGGFCNTAGSQAMHAFRRHHYTGGIYVHRECCGTTQEQSTYRGGRCESYRIGVINTALWYVDFKSCYPFLSSQIPLPVRLRHTLRGHDRAAIEKHCSASGVLARVLITTTEPCYPYCHGKETIFPTGTFLTTLAGPELKDALDNNRVLRFYDTNVYDLEPALQGYANALLAARQEATDTGQRHLAQMFKLVGNSIVGKMGQANRFWKNRPDIQTGIEYGLWYGVDERGKPCRYRSVACITQQEVTDGFVENAVPAIAAWITSAARMQLVRAMRVAGYRHVYYCDTDALMVDDIGLENLNMEGMIVENTIGKLGTRWGPCNVEIRGVKYYVRDGQITCAGMPGGQCHDMGDGIHFRMSTSPIDALKRGRRPETQEVIMTYQREIGYRGGKVLPNGIVVPWRVRDGQIENT